MLLNKRLISTRCLNYVGAGVYLSSCFNAHYNLALEDWLYSTYNSQRLLLIYRNLPCVVIGRHQNPWCEYRPRPGVTLARRRSGGGTVYHDLDNINFSFFSPRSGYDRKANLDILVRSLHYLDPNLELTVTKRDDIELSGAKISGTAAKLGAQCAYHHCTLLVKVNELLVKDLLQPSVNGLDSRATTSVRTPVTCINRHNSAITHDDIITAVRREYARENLDNTQSIITYLDPTSMPDVRPYFLEQTSWEHIYGTTPKFTVQRTFVTDYGDIQVTLEVIKGHVNSLTLTNVAPEVMGALSSVLIGRKFNQNDLNKGLNELEESMEKHIKTIMKQLWTACQYR